MVIYLCNLCDKNFNRKSIYVKYCNKKYTYQTKNISIFTVPDVPAEPKNRANLCQSVPIIINDQIENNNIVDIISCKHYLKCFKNNSSIGSTNMDKYMVKFGFSNY
jgi:hypothetical protein